MKHMETTTALQKKQDALWTVVDAASIHRDRLTESLKSDHYNSDRSFNAARIEYIRKVTAAIGELRLLKLDENLKVSERVRDLSLEEAVDLLHTVEDHIRALRHHRRSDLA